MFVYLSKKIAIPNNTRLNCLAWNGEHGYVAVGGEDGLLKVLKLDQHSGSQPAAPSAMPRGLAAPNNLSMNQTLEGHKGSSVQVVTWNEKQLKLTSSDRDGVIMVWMLYKGSWYEEMTNDRKKSTVKGMAWTADGERICIVYEDGAIIVGSVDGNRIWGKELKNTALTGVQWSPDGRLLLFSIRNGELHMYDNQGTFVMKLTVQCVTLGPTRSLSVIGVCWFNGSAPPNRPVLAICYENGKMQFMCNENDDQPVVIDTYMQTVSCAWNHDGTLFAVCGTVMGSTEKEFNQVSFYSAHGKHLRSLKVPGREISALAWEAKSLRIALAVDSFIYFANIRADYHWAYFNKTLAFVNSENVRQGCTITFWDTVSNQCFIKQVDTVIGMAATTEHCVMALEHIRQPDDKDMPSEAAEKFQLLVCNTMSTTLDAKYSDVRPSFLGINSSFVAVASKNQFLLWHYNTPKGVASLHLSKMRRDKRFHIDDNPSGVVEVLNDLDRTGYDLPVNDAPTTDPICCLAISEVVLLIGRESGLLQEYTVPQVALCNRYNMPVRPSKIAINCNSTKAAIIDANGGLATIELSRKSSLSLGPSADQFAGGIERKDVWAVCWARDNPQLLAIMEKTRMYVFRGSDPEEPISCTGYICDFDDLEISAVMLDDLVNGVTTPNHSEHFLQLRVKSLRDTEELLTHVGIAEAKQFIEDNPHPRLWRLLAEASLKKLDLDTAETAFVRSNSYPGVQLIKRLRTIQNKTLARAEIVAFYGNFDEAERLYLEADRRNMGITLRHTLSDWFRVVTLYRMGTGVSDEQLELAWREIGNHFANQRVWASAREYYEKAHYLEGLIEALYYLEDYEGLHACVERVPEKSPLLGRLGTLLASVGMCEEAVAAYERQGDIKAAVGCCVNLRQWGTAVDLAQKFKLSQVGTLLGKHAAQLLEDGRLHEAVELQRKAGRYLDSARLLMKLLDGEVKKKTNLLVLKKICILAGLLTEDHLKGQFEERQSVLNKLPPDDAALITHIWHSAEAYHFFLLAQKQLKSGLVHSAMLTCLRLREYEDVLDPKKIYNILALASCADRAFGTASKAFIKLESLVSLSDVERNEYEELAVNIFSTNDPVDNRVERIDCFSCEALVPDWCTACPNCACTFPACVSSGQSLIDPRDAWICPACHHLSSEVLSRQTCTFCHHKITGKETESF